MSVLSDDEVRTFLKVLIKVAFEAPAPNSLTPQIVQLAQGLELEMNRREAIRRRQPTPQPEITHERE